MATRNHIGEDVNTTAIPKHMSAATEELVFGLLRGDDKTDRIRKVLMPRLRSGLKGLGYETIGEWDLGTEENNGRFE